MSIKNTLKLIKYNQSPEISIVSLVICGGVSLFTSIPLRFNSFIGSFWANYVTFYLITQVYCVLFSGLVQSSEKYKKIVIKNLAIIMGILNVVNFIIFGLIRTTLAYKMGTEKYVGSFLIGYMIFQILYLLFVTLMYKKMVLGTLIAIPMFTLVMLANFRDWWFSYNGSILLIVVIAGAVSILSPLLYYFLATMLYKVPFSAGMLKRLERVQ